MVTFLIIAAIVFCVMALIAEDFPKRKIGNRSHRQYYHSNKHYYYDSKNYHSNNDQDVYCPECGSPNVTVYEDGSCECQDCQFPFHIDML
jgi:Zn finger protein HypA/HybF involved in hydrogenase expression